MKKESLTRMEDDLRPEYDLRTAEGHEFVLAEIEDFDREIDLTRQNEELMRLLDRRGQEKATISLAEARVRSGVD